MNSWIKTIGPDDAVEPLASVYRRISGPDGQVDHILQAHGLRPHTLEGHLGLYKAVLHHAGNRLPRELLEAIGIHVSVLNGCDYCVRHHAEGLRRLAPADAERRIEALCRSLPELAFDRRECAALAYAGQLTLAPSRVGEADLVALRSAGYDDGEILEINQVAAYFAYANRTVLGLGVTSEGETLGLSPSGDDGDDWGHR